MVELEPLEPGRHFYDGITVTCHLWIFGVKVAVYLRYREVRVPAHLQALYAHGDSHPETMQ